MERLGELTRFVLSLPRGTGFALLAIELNDVRQFGVALAERLDADKGTPSFPSSISPVRRNHDGT